MPTSIEFALLARVSSHENEHSLWRCELGESVVSTDMYMYEVPDAVPPIHTVSSHVATDKDPSK